MQNRSIQLDFMATTCQIGRAILVAALLLFLPNTLHAQTEVMPKEDAGEIQPITVDNSQAIVGVDSIKRSDGNERPVVKLGFPADQGSTILAENLNGPSHRLLRRLYKEGLAAGNWGDLYENRDRNHSTIDLENYPQITEIVYSDDLKAKGLDYGLGLSLLFDAPLIGNSSTAITTGNFQRSLPRMALTGLQQSAIRALFQNYVSGQLHVYPEHRDHDSERGDLFPANTPYYLISKGSSGSDKPFIEALIMILAAFRPDTKARLIETGLLSPTLQMVFRRGQNGITSRANYMSGLAHPTVFEASGINLVRMVGLANSILPEDIPPMVHLSVTWEPTMREGLDFFGDGLSEHLLDTPAAIARIWRAPAYRRSMIVSAKSTRDPNDRPLTFNWVLLRGNPAHVRIEPLGENGQSAKITIDWQGRNSAPGQSDIQSGRVDIGIFAHNGRQDSAPSFLSFIFPLHEVRNYEIGPNGETRISSINRAPRDGTYVDPLLFPLTPWRDEYHYNESGTGVGWTRWKDGVGVGYDALGHVSGVPPQYKVIQDSRGLPMVQEN